MLFTILLDRSEDTMDNFESILRFFANFQDRIKRFIAVPPQRGLAGYMSMFKKSISPSGSKSYPNWHQSKLKIASSESIPLESKQIPLNLGGSFSFNSIWWNECMCSLAEYMLDLKHLVQNLRPLHKSLIQVWSLSSEEAFVEFHSNKQNIKIMNSLDYKMKAITKNREEIMEYFTNTNPNYCHYQFLV